MYTSGDNPVGTGPLRPKNLLLRIKKFLYLWNAPEDLAVGVPVIDVDVTARGSRGTGLLEDLEAAGEVVATDVRHEHTARRRLGKPLGIEWHRYGWLAGWLARCGSGCRSSAAGRTRDVHPPWAAGRTRSGLRRARAAVARASRAAAVCGDRTQEAGGASFPRNRRSSSGERH